MDLIVSNAIESLSPEDRKLPQIISLVPFFRRGIGIHHGGLLPVLKELVEILFAEGLIKVCPFEIANFGRCLNIFLTI